MMNFICLIGRLTRDPELRRTGSGVAVTSFTLAVDRDYAPEGQEKETDFIDCVAWRQTGELVAKYFTKGRMAAVNGRLQIRNWQDKDGNKRRSAEVLVDNVYFVDSKKNTEGATNNLGDQMDTDYELPARGDYDASQNSYNAPKGGYNAPKGGYNAPNGGGYGAPIGGTYAPADGSYNGGNGYY
jgi:single-strand DNA-binding protein